MQYDYTVKFSASSPGKRSYIPPALESTFLKKMRSRFTPSNVRPKTRTVLYALEGVSILVDAY